MGFSMANNKQRYVNTRFWNDSFVSGLDPVEKLMFIYLLTNEHTNIAGVYELPLKIMGVETGFETSMIKKILPRLRSKIQYIDGMVVIRNFVKHQETSSDRVQTGISNCLKDLDKDFLKNIVNKGYYLLPKHYIDTLSIPYTYPPNYLDSNSNLDSNSKAETSSASFSFKEELKKLDESPRRDLNIIGFYLEERMPDIRSKEQLSKTIKRHLRAAKDLTPFDDDQIVKGFQKAKAQTPEWVLETVSKVLTK